MTTRSNKTEVIRLRLTCEQKEALKLKAKVAGMSLSAYLRREGLKREMRSQKATQIIRAIQQDSSRISAAKTEDELRRALQEAITSFKEIVALVSKP